MEDSKPENNFAYQNIGRTSSFARKTFAGRLHGKDLEILDSSISPRFCIGSLHNRHVFISPSHVYIRGAEATD